MADFSALKTSIQNYIKQNGNEEITGNLLQQILLSMVSTLGDSAINDLVTALNNEVSARQNADGTLQTNINNEATARGNADTQLGNRITSEAETREGADRTLRGLIDGIVANIENGYVYAGIATPSSTPASGKVFYLALTAGTYTNFGATVVPQGINILKYNGSAWSVDMVIAIDDKPTDGSGNLVKSGGVYLKINQEKNRAEAAEGILQQNITAEKNRAEEAEDSLHQEIQSEKNERKQEIQDVRDDVFGLIHDYKPIVIEGNVVNAPDEEDITQQPNNLLKFKDKAYNPTVFSGLGRKYLRKNVVINEDYVTFDGFLENPECEDLLVGTPDAILWARLPERFVAQKDDTYYLDWEGSEDYIPVNADKIYVNDNIPYTWNGEDLIVDDNLIERYGNTLTQEMMSEANTIYVIQYDYTLGENITVPDNCILKFDGGSISGGTVTLTNIGIKGTYLGNNVQYSGSIRIDTAVRLKDFNITGSININTTEHIVLENCIINAVSGTNGAINLPANANVTLKNCELYTENSSYYGIVSSYKVASLVVENCKIHDFYRAGIYTVFAIKNAKITHNEIYNIGNFISENSIGSFGIKIGTNVVSPYVDYQDNRIEISNNHIHDIFTYYLEGNDATECHGILLYSHNVVITNNKVENLLGGTSQENLSIFGGTEHEGIYVKGFNPYIVGNVLINACGNISCDGAISHKWFGAGGVFADNYIEQYFGHGIYSQSSGLVITGNTIIIKDPVDINTESKPIERHACIYANTVDYTDPDQKDCPSQIVNNIISNYSTIDNEYPTIYCQTSITSYNVSDNTIVSKDNGGFFRINHYTKNNVDVDLVNNVALNISDNIVDIKGLGGLSYGITIFSQTYGSLTDYTLLDIIFNNNKITTNTQSTDTFFLNRSAYAKNLSFINNNFKGEQIINFISFQKFGEVTVEGNNISNHIKYLFYILTTETSTNFVIKDNIIKELEYILLFKSDTTRQLNTILVKDNFIAYDYTYLVRGESTTNKIIDGVNLYVLGNKKINYLSNGITWNLNTFSKSVISDVFKSTIGLKNLPIGFDNEQDGKIIWWNGTRYVDGEGVRYDALHSGTWANRPTASEVPVGFQYFCIDKPSSPGSPIYCTGEGWVYADGTAVS